MNDKGVYINYIIDNNDSMTYAIHTFHFIIIDYTSFYIRTVCMTVCIRTCLLFVLLSVCSSSFEVFRSRSANINRGDLQLFTSNGV